MNPNRQEMIATWRGQEREPFAGWDFSYLDGRMIEEQPAWSYLAHAAELMDCASSALDMGTGGGERLLRLRDHWPARVVVTEDYTPNVALARGRLEPLGVTVVEVALGVGIAMPFSDGEFDLVLNRHSGLNPAEVARVLAPGGTFLTQQVHALWAHDLLAHFDAAPPWPDDTPEIVAPRLETVGLETVTCLDWSGTLTFTDVGAIVYYLKAIPWLVPRFSVDTHVEYLLALQERLERGEVLRFAAKKYLIEARKPRSVEN